LGELGHGTHFEAAGVMNQFAFHNPLNNQRFSIVGGGGSLNAGIDVGKGWTVLTANFYGDGGGRFIYGEAPALIIEGDGAPSLLHSMSTLNGVEYQATPKWKLWTYYGGTYIDKNVAIDPSNGKAVGYGYVGSPNKPEPLDPRGYGRIHARVSSRSGFRQLSVQRPILLADSSPLVRSTRPARQRQSQYGVSGIRYVLPAAAAAGK